MDLQLSKVSDTVSPRLNSIVQPEDVSPRSRVENENELKHLTDKLRQAEQKNAEYRNQVQGLKTEIKMAQKVAHKYFSSTIKRTLIATNT